MTDITLESPHGPLPAYLSLPQGIGPWPGVVVIHDAVGMSRDLRQQADWLASQGFIAVAPNLYSWGSRFRCVISVIRNQTRRAGRAFDEIETSRTHLADRDDCTGQIGIIGFCLGGGFAVLAAQPTFGFSASSTNYGPVPKDADTLLAKACPVVGSYGAKDRFLRDDPTRLEAALSKASVAHDIKVYEGAGHGFMNNHRRSEVPMIFRIMSWMTGGDEYDRAATSDARKRIADFFAEHLGPR